MNCNPWCRAQYSETEVKNNKKLPRDNSESIFHTMGSEIIKPEMSNEEPTNTEKANYQLTV